MATGILTTAEMMVVDGNGLSMLITFDSLDSTQFLRSDAVDTATQKIKFEKGLEPGYLYGYADYNAIVDFGSDAAGTERRYHCRCDGNRILLYNR